MGQRAAEIAATASKLGRFWPLHWRLVNNGPVNSEERIWELVEAAEIERQEVEALMAAGHGRERVSSDLSEANILGVRGMPTTYIGGHKVEGAVSSKRLRREIEAALERSRTKSSD